MAPSTSPPDQDQERPGGDGLSGLTVHDLQVSLTVIKAQAQMLRRKARRHGLANGEEVSARLAMIDDVATRLSTKIQALRRPDNVDAPPNHG